MSWCVYHNLRTLHIFVYPFIPRRRTRPSRPSRSRRRRTATRCRSRSSSARRCTTHSPSRSSTSSYRARSPRQCTRSRQRTTRAPRSRIPSAPRTAFRRPSSPPPPRGSSSRRGSSSSAWCVPRCACEHADTNTNTIIITVVPDRAEARAPVFALHPAVRALARRVRGAAVLVLGRAAHRRRAAVQRGAARTYRLRGQVGAVEHRRGAHRAQVSYWRAYTKNL